MTLNQNDSFVIYRKPFKSEINIIKGDMRFIGPRPCISTEKDLINLRKKYKIIYEI